MRCKIPSLVGLALAAVVLTAAAPAPKELSGKLEMFSWWTAGGEADGLNAMYTLYRKAYPKVEIVNATVAGGAGTNAKAVLSTRLTGGDPPDSFQLHAGLEVEKYEPRDTGKWDKAYGEFRRVLRWRPRDNW